MTYNERRRRAVVELKEYLAEHGSPRRDMYLIVMVTGTAAFWLCYAMLHLGIFAMWIRYPVAVLASYPVFVGMIRLWLNRPATRALDEERQEREVRGDGGLGGGDVPHLGLGDFAIAFDDFMIVALPFIAAFSVVIYGLYVAPAILAEVLLDGALMAGLYHHFKHVPRRNWMATSIRKTLWMFVVTAGLLGVAGAVVQSEFPHATSIGVLWDTMFHKE